MSDKVFGPTVSYVRPRIQLPAEIVTYESGLEQRNRIADRPIWEFELGWRVLRESDVRSVLNFWLEHGGNLYTFLWQHPTLPARAGEVLGRGNGLRTLFKTYEDRFGGATVYKDGVTQTAVGGTQSATDDFNRANNTALGANWTESENDVHAVKIETNQLLFEIRNTASAPRWGYGRYSAISWAADQRSSLKWRASFASQFGDPYAATGGPAVRTSGTFDNFTGYVAMVVRHINAGTHRIELHKYVNQSLQGDGTILGTFNVSLALNDVVKIEAKGSAIKVFVNDVERISVTDSAISTGSAGVAVRGPRQASIFEYTHWDDWTGQEVPADVTLDGPTGKVTFAAAPASGALITADVTSAFFRVRFGDPLLNQEYFVWRLVREQRLTVIQAKQAL